METNSKYRLPSAYAFTAMHKPSLEKLEEDQQRLHWFLEPDEYT